MELIHLLIVFIIVLVIYIIILHNKLKERNEIIVCLAMANVKNDSSNESDDDSLNKSDDDKPSIHNKKVDLSSNIKRTATCYECGHEIYLDYDDITYNGSCSTYFIKCDSCKKNIRLDNKVAQPIANERWKWKQENTYAR